MGRGWSLWLLVFVLGPLICLPAVEVRLAPLAVADDVGGSPSLGIHPERDLLADLQSAADSDVLEVRSAETEPEGRVLSFLEAARLCESRGYPYLLYGFVKRSEFSFSAEVKLLDAESKSVAATFFDSDDKDHYPRLMHDLALRIVSYFSNEVGLKPSAHKPASGQNLLAFPLTLGYWTPTSSAWSPVLAGLGAVDAGIRFIPFSPLFRLFSRDWYVALGLDVEYAIGMNQPGYESYFLHSARLRLPVELVFQAGGGHALSLGAGPLVQVDFMVQDRLYAPPYSKVTPTGGVSLSASYRYSFSELLSVGLETVFDIAFYEQPLMSVSPRIFLELTPGGTREASGE